MSKIDATDDKQIATQIRSGGATEHAGAAVEAADKAGHATREAAESGGEIAGAAAAAGQATSEQTTELSVATFAAAVDQAGIWRDLATAQLEHNVEAFAKLAAARSWPEQLAIQHGYLRGNVERFVAAASRCMTLAESMSSRRQRRHAVEPPAQA